MQSFFAFWWVVKSGGGIHWKAKNNHFLFSLLLSLLKSDFFTFYTFTFAFEKRKNHFSTFTFAFEK
jgi:hypothetical protein